MTRNGRMERKGESGFTLLEMIIASAIFAIAASVAFILYTAAQKSYKAGQNFTDQQQNTRAAFDRVLSDLRNAGYNYNPDGSKSRPDEKDSSKTAEEERSDVGEVVAFLRHFLEDSDWAIARMSKLLAAKSGFQDAE